MPTCQNCSYEWSWKETFKNSFRFDTFMICPHCKAKQYTTSRSRMLSAVVTIITNAMIMIYSIVFSPSVVTIVILLIVFPFIFLFYPFWVKFSNEEETFW